LAKNTALYKPDSPAASRTPIGAKERSGCGHVRCACVVFTIRVLFASASGLDFLVEPPATYHLVRGLRSATPSTTYPRRSSPSSSSATPASIEHRSIVRSSPAFPPVPQSRNSAVDCAGRVVDRARLRPKLCTPALAGSAMASDRSENLAPTHCCSLTNVYATQLAQRRFRNIITLVDFDALECLACSHSSPPSLASSASITAFRSVMCFLVKYIVAFSSASTTSNSLFANSRSSGFINSLDPWACLNIAA
jgi:hypothetical protein